MTIQPLYYVPRLHGERVNKSAHDAPAQIDLAELIRAFLRAKRHCAASPAHARMFAVTCREVAASLPDDAGDLFLSRILGDA